MLSKNYGGGVGDEWQAHTTTDSHVEVLADGMDKLNCG